MDLSPWNKHHGCWLFTPNTGFIHCTGVANTHALSNSHWGGGGGDPSDLWFRRSEFEAGPSSCHLSCLCPNAQPGLRTPLLSGFDPQDAHPRVLRYTNRKSRLSFSKQNIRLTSAILLQLMSEQAVFPDSSREFLCSHFHRAGRKRAALRVVISDILEISECPVLQRHCLNLYHLTTLGCLRRH